MAESLEVLEENWYKAALGLKYTRIGIKTFVEENIEKFHQRVYSNVMVGHPTRANCSNCLTQNVVPCPTKNICGKRNNCQFHDNTNPGLHRRPCPNNICDKVRDEIKKHHRYGEPSFRNTSAERWYTSSWELAKCFMAATGYQNTKQADDTDFTGIISVVLNHLDFQGLISENLVTKNNLFEQLLNDNAVVSLEERKTLRKEAIDALKSIEEAKLEALDDISLKEKEIVTMKIQADIAKTLAEKEIDGKRKDVIKDAERQISFEIERRHKLLDQKIEKITQEIGDTKATMTDLISTKTDEGLDKLESKISELSSEYENGLEREKQRLIEYSKNDISETKNEAIYELKERNKVCVENAKVQITRSQENAIEDIIYKSKEIVEMVEAAAIQTSIQQDIGVCQKLKNHLIEHYQRNGYLKIPISPLVDDVEIDLEEVFVMPDMRVTDYKENNNSGQNPFQFYRETYLIRSISALFKKGDSNIRRVCIGADGGFGKTTLCQMMISTWVRVHTEKKASAYISKSDCEFLKGFNYLFYLPLRDLYGILKVDEMIKQHLVKVSLHSMLKKVLHTESKKCLIILDGLDEWQGIEAEIMPNIDFREEYTILMTSRPYKIERLRPKQRHVEQEVQIVGLSNTNKMVIKLVELLNKKHNKKRRYKICPCYSSYWNYTYNMDPRINLWEPLANVPILLSQMVCLWFDGRTCGNTRVGIYFNMVDMLLEVADIKSQLDTKEMYQKYEKELNIPDWYGDLHFCRKYRVLLQMLSELAFNTIINGHKDDGLIFLHSKTEIFGLTKKDIDICLNAGLLSQSKFTGKATSKSKRLSFLHKNFQEFFTALYIANNKAEINVKSVLNKCSQVSDVFEKSGILVGLCGLSPNLIGLVTGIIAGFADSESKILQYRRSIISCEPPSIVKRVQDLVFDCIEEALVSPTDIDAVILRDIIPYGFEWLDRKCLPSFENLESIPFEGVKSFKSDDLHDLKVFLGNQRSLQELCLLDVEGSDKQEAVYFFKHLMTNASSLAHLKLSSFYHENISYLELIEAIRLSNISILEIVGFRCAHNAKVLLQQAISDIKHLECLVLSDIDCTTCTENKCHFRLNTSNKTSLKYCLLHRINVFIEQGENFPIESLTVSQCENAALLLQTLSFSESLVKLELSQGKFQFRWLDIDLNADLSRIRIMSISGLESIRESFPSDQDDDTFSENDSNGEKEESGSGNEKTEIVYQRRKYPTSSQSTVDTDNRIQSSSSKKYGTGDKYEEKGGFDAFSPSGSYPREGDQKRQSHFDKSLRFLASNDNGAENISRKKSANEKNAQIETVDKEIRGKDVDSSCHVQGIDKTFCSDVSDSFEASDNQQTVGFDSRYPTLNIERCVDQATDYKTSEHQVADYGHIGVSEGLAGFWGDQPVSSEASGSGADDAVSSNEIHAGVHNAMHKDSCRNTENPNEKKSTKFMDLSQTLCESIPMFRTLKVLRVQDFDFEESVIKLPTSMKSLELLCLNNVNLSHGCLKNLVDDVINLKQTVVVALQNVTVHPTTDEIMMISYIVQKCTLLYVKYFDAQKNISGIKNVTCVNSKDIDVEEINSIILSSYQM